MARDPLYVIASTFTGAKRGEGRRRSVVASSLRTFPARCSRLRHVVQYEWTELARALARPRSSRGAKRSITRASVCASYRAQHAAISCLFPSMIRTPSAINAPLLLDEHLPPSPPKKRRSRFRVWRGRFEFGYYSNSNSNSNFRFKI